MAAPTLSRTKTSPNFNLGAAKEEESGQGEKQKRYLLVETVVFAATLVVVELVLFVIYCIWFDYLPAEEAEEEFNYLYGVFRDVNIMIFAGFGLLMCFLRRYSYSAIGYTLLISALVVQESIVLEAFFEGLEHTSIFSHRYGVGILNLLDGLFAAGAVMISYGAILGKVSPLQLLVMGVCEPFFYWLNIYICAFQLEVVDVGGGYYIHMFGCYFGLAVCLVCSTRKSRAHPDNTSCYSSDLFSLIGTLLLWLLWPSFNAAIAPDGIPRLRAVVNTFLSLTGATVATFVASRVLEGCKFDPVHVQNSTLAGGVAMGIVAHLKLFPATALAVGALSGVVSVLGYRFLSPFLNNHLFIQDVCGVHNLHGMPSLIAALLGVFATLGLSQKGIDDDLLPRGEWQPFFQVAAIGITLGLALASGAIVGFLMRATQLFHSMFAAEYFNDRTFWVLPSDYEMVVREQDDSDSDDGVI